MRPIQLTAFMGLLVTCAATALAADTTNKIKGEVVEFGTYKTLGSQELVPTKSKSGEKSSVNRGRTQLIEQTDVIEARKGVSFGLRYRLTSVPPNAPIILKSTISHPEFVSPDGKKVSIQTQPLEFRPEVATHVHYLGYTLDNNFEIVPGDWTLSISGQDHIVVSKTFHVKR